VRVSAARRSQSDGLVHQSARRAAPHPWWTRAHLAQRRGRGGRLGARTARGARGTAGSLDGGPSGGGRPRREPNRPLARRQAAPCATPSEGVTWAPYRRGVHARGSRTRPPAPAARIKRRLLRTRQAAPRSGPLFGGIWLPRLSSYVNFICALGYSPRRVQRTSTRA